MKRRLNFSAEQAYTYIRHKIVTGEFTPGHLLAAQDLAIEIGVSRTPVRDALRVLEQEGLVELTPRQESRVKSLSYQEFRETCELRIALESYFVMLAAELRTEEDLATLESSLEKMKSLADEVVHSSGKERLHLMRALANEDIRFHMTIADASRNLPLKTELTRLQILSYIIIARHEGKGDLQGEVLRSNLDEVWAAHMRIFDAIRSGSPQLAKAAMEAHLSYGMKLQLDLKQRMDVTDPDFPLTML